LTMFRRIWDALDSKAQDAIFEQFGTAGKVLNVVRKAQGLSTSTVTGPRTGDDDDDDVIDAEFVELKVVAAESDDELGDDEPAWPRRPYDNTTLLERLVEAFVPAVDSAE